MVWANAQMDNKFYQPSKEMKTFEYSTPVENFSLPVGDDTITAYMGKAPPIPYSPSARRRV